MGDESLEEIWNTRPHLCGRRSGRWPKKKQRLALSGCKYPECPEPRLFRHQYCLTHAKSVDYVTRRGNLAPVQKVVCPRCGAEEFKQKQVRLPRSAAWEAFCRDCRAGSWLRHAPLKMHRVPADLITRWLMQGRALACDICRRPFTQTRPPLVDHDHAHCVKHSCGECVRGIVCHQCNVRLGHIEQMIGLELLDLTINYVREKKG
jgi:hypothetical protein